MNGTSLTPQRSHPATLHDQRCCGPRPAALCPHRLRLPFALCGALLILAHAGFAQTWQTVDDYQYFGQGAYANGLAVAPNGTIFAAGTGTGPGGLQHALIMASADGGNTWSGPLDDFTGGSGYDAQYSAIASDSAGNLYAAGTYYPDATQDPLHWLVRRSIDGGVTWSAVDDFAPSPYGLQPNGMAVDASGNVYVAGSAYGPWIIRKGVGGVSFSTVDSLSSNSSANGIYVHPTAGIFAVGFATVPGTKGYFKTQDWLVRRSLDGGATWSTVDSFQLSAGLPSTAFGIGADAHGNLYVVGRCHVLYKKPSAYYFHWVVRKSSNGGSTWNTVDDYQLSPTASSAGYCFAADSLGNLFVAGLGVDTNGGHWVVRENPGGTGTWSTADNFQYVTGVQSIPAAIAANASGNVFVGGSGNDSTGNNHWLVRRR